MARRGKRDEWEPALGNDEFDEDVVVTTRKHPEGDTTAVILPRSITRLSGEAREVVSVMQHRAALIAHMRDELEELAQEARSLGVPWTAIGWSTGMTSQAARQRWGRVDG